MGGSAISRRDRIVDVCVTAVFLALSALLIVGVVDDGQDRGVAAVVAVAHNAPLVVRRRWPVAVVAAMALTAVASVALGVPIVVLGPAVTVGLFTVGARTAPRIGRPVLAVVVVVMAAVVVANNGDVGTVVTNAVALTVAWWLGDRSRRAAAETEAQRAVVAETARRAALDERMRIARELHDVVAHAMTVIAVQAGTGRFVIDSAPDVARNALVNIETTSRGALQEMRRLLTVLRDDDSAPGEMLPAPGVDGLDELVRSSAGTDLDVEIVTCGEPAPLPTGLQLCVYRVVQEALTNVRRHAHATRVVVTLAYEPSWFSVTIHDDGLGETGTPAAGHGLIGMRERVGLYGGTLEAGGRDGHGWIVAARFPVGEIS